MDPVTAGFVAAGAVIALFIKLGFTNLRRILRYDFAVDLVFTVILAMFMSGSNNGIQTAMFSGLVLSIFLFTLKLFVGYEEKQVAICNTCHAKTKVWRRIPGKFQFV